MGICRMPLGDGPPTFCPKLGVPVPPKKKPSSSGLTVPTAGWGGSSDEAMVLGVLMLRLGPSPRLSCGRGGEMG